MAQIGGGSGQGANVRSCACAATGVTNVSLLRGVRFLGTKPGHSPGHKSGPPSEIRPAGQCVGIGIERFEVRVTNGNPTSREGWQGKLLSDGACQLSKRSLSPLRFLISVCVVARPSWCSRWCAGNLQTASATWVLPTLRRSLLRVAPIRFFDNDDVARTALHTPMQVALSGLISPSETATVAHDLSILNYSGHNRKEDLIPVGNDRTWGCELFRSMVIETGVTVGAAVTELRCCQEILSSQSDEAIPFLDHLEQAERAVDSVDKLLPERL